MGINLKPGGGWAVRPERVGRPKAPGKGAFVKVLENAKVTPGPRKLEGSGGPTVRNVSMARDAKAQEANLRVANTIPPEPIWYTPGEKEMSIPSGLNPGGGAPGVAAARAMPGAEAAPAPAAHEAPRPYHHAPLHRAQQAAQAAAAQPEAMDAEPTPPPARQEERKSDARWRAEAEYRAKNNKRLQNRRDRFEGTGIGENQITDNHGVRRRQIAYNAQKIPRVIARRETIASARARTSAQAMDAEPTPPARPTSAPPAPATPAQRSESPPRQRHDAGAGPSTPPQPRRPSSAAPRTKSLRDEHANRDGRNTPERFRPPVERQGDSEPARAPEVRVKTPKRFNHHTPDEVHNRQQKESIRAKEDALRLMFPGIPNDVLRRAVYDGFLMDPSRRPGQLVFVRRGPLGGTGVANPEITDYLRPYNVHGLGRVPGPPPVPEHIVHPRGNIPPPVVQARRR